jgi:hypothetical protein
VQVTERVGPEEEKSNFNQVVSNICGPNLLGHEVLGCKEIEWARGEVGGADDPDLLVDPSLCHVQVDQVKAKSVIDKLDNMVLETHGRIQERHIHEFSEANSNLPRSSSSSVQGREIQLISKPKRQKKTVSRLPFPHLVGPKCLRLMEVVNSVSASCRKKRSTTGLGETSFESTEVAGEASNKGGEQLELVPRPDDGGDPSQVMATQSGVALILGEGLGDGTDDLVTGRNESGDLRSDAEQILEIQEALGLKFNEEKGVTVDRLVELEERDRAKLENCQENQGFQ